MSEADLVRQAATGDIEAFERLFRAYRDHAFAVAASVLGSPEEAADVVQDGFLAALEQLPTLRDGRRFASWLTTIVRRGALRRRHRRTEPVDDDTLDELPALWDRHTPFHGAMACEARQRIEQAVRELPERLADTLRLRYRQDLSYKEIAEALGVPVSTIKARLYDARQALRPSLEAYALDSFGGHPMPATDTLLTPPTIRIEDLGASSMAATLVEDPSTLMRIEADASSEVVWFRYWDPSYGKVPQVRCGSRVVAPARVEEEECWKVRRTSQGP